MRWMKFRSSCLLPLIAVVFCLALVPGTAVALPPLPATTCLMIDKADAPKVDGRLDDAVWARAEQTVHFSGMWGGAVDAKLASTRLLCDGDWLYVAFQGSETNMRDDHAEAVGLYLAPLTASDEFVRVIVRIKGKTIERRRITRFEIPNTDWRVAYKRTNADYTLEFAIPVAKIFMIPPKQGDAFELNVARQRKKDDGADNWDIWCWSACGSSPSNRYRFGQVLFGDYSDGLGELRKGLKATLASASAKFDGASDDITKPFDALESKVRTFLGRIPEKIDGNQWRQIQDTAASFDYQLRRIALAGRGVIVSACNPMQPPMSYEELPPVDVEDATNLDIKVLANEWESASLVVTNLSGRTLDGQVTISEFESADGKTKLPGWDIVQVRTAPLLHLLTGRSKRDPLPELSQGDLFRVASGDNELLWLTFKSRGVAPGRYKAKLTVRALDGSVRRDIDVTFRVYPLELGAKGKPRVMAWNSWLRGKDSGQKVQHALDYYMNVFCFVFADAIPQLDAAAVANPPGERVDFTRFDQTWSFTFPKRAGPASISICLSFPLTGPRPNGSDRRRKNTWAHGWRNSRHI